MNTTTNARAYLAPCLYEALCTTRRSIMKNSLMMGVTHEGFSYEEDTWGAIDDYDEE